MREFISLHSREIQNILMTVAALFAVMGFASAFPRFLRRFFHQAGRFLARLARSELRAILLVAGFSLALCVLTFVITGPAIPRLHDEFSYLLAADTFAHGRLSNPPLPDGIWPFFETMHELMQPTYASKFGPAQGLCLALGQVLTGEPLVGVWISTILGCAAMTWALYGWMRPRWALVAGLLTAIHPQIIYWSHIYWGGTVGMLGGALIFGSIGRMLFRARAIDAITLVIGLAIVGNSRPYEALLWVIAAGTTIIGARLLAPSPSTLGEGRGEGFVPILRNANKRENPHPDPLPAYRERGWIWRLALPAFATAIPILVWMGYYNFRVTGSVTTLPYSLHTQSFMTVPLFYWNDPPPSKTYRHEALRHHHDVYERWYFETQTTLAGWAQFFGAKIYKFWEQFLIRSLVLTAGFLVLPWALVRDWQTKLCLGYLGLFALGWAIIPWFEHHYPAPLMPVIVFLGIRGARWINAWRWRGVGRALVRWCLVSCIAVLPLSLKREYLNNHGTGWWVLRSQMIENLQREGGKHLVIVRYGPAHISGCEWVYNPADIKQTPVIFAREMDKSEMPRLFDYFGDRKVWRLEVDRDDQPPKLTPYLR